MAHLLRLHDLGALSLLVNRIGEQLSFFTDVAHAQRYVHSLHDALPISGWQVHALCLMPNHFHMVVETPRGRQVTRMNCSYCPYTGAFNWRHKLFQEVATRLVFGGGEVPEGAVGADEGATGSGT